MVEHSEHSNEGSTCSLSVENVVENKPGYYLNNSNRFSIFKWFKKPPDKVIKQSTSPNQSDINHSNCNSSSESVDTFYSTATVKSFAFYSGNNNHSDKNNKFKFDLIQPANKIGPFGSGASKFYDKYQSNVTKTLPANVLSKKCDITTRYSLQSYTSSFGSCQNISKVHRNNSFKQINERPFKKFHVKGKRRAPKPPTNSSINIKINDGNVTINRKLKRRPAPKPPENKVMNLNKNVIHSNKQQQVISTDTLILQDGILMSKKESFIDDTNNRNQKTMGSQNSSAILRPWYKRTGFENKKMSDDQLATTSSTSKNINDNNSLSRLKFFNKTTPTAVTSSITVDDHKQKDSKRRSGILTNISELDKEAAAIVQEEQAKSRASFVQPLRIEKTKEENQEVIQDIVTSSIENSPRRSTRALISKFNAIGNKTKVTVNTNFFKKEQKTCSNDDDDDDHNNVDDKRMKIDNRKSLKETDLSKYFPQSPKATKSNLNDSRMLFLQSMTNSDSKQNKINVKEPQKLINDVTNRLTALQEIISPKVQQTTAGAISRKIYNEKKPDVTLMERRNKSELIQKEFSNIFEEIDKQLNSFGVKKTVGTSNQVDKVLEILIEAEKNPKPIKKSDEIHLKEMLKEMKHSLPKRPKNKSIVNDGASTSSASSNHHLIKSTSNVGSQKVSSSVQTSGNVRKIDTNNWKNDGVIYRTSGRNKNSDINLIKNTFQLMRPREFAAIEAIKTMKSNHNDDSNTYANVIEQSLYANALILPSRSHEIISINKNEISKNRLPTPNEHKYSFVQPCSGSKNPKDDSAKNMNTLAVNRLLKKLEGAIASGNHQQASGLAKELATLKIQCSVVRQKPKTNQLNVDMYIEDRLAHQGPIPLQLPLTITVAELKLKIFNEFEIPVNVQRWIIGKTLAHNDEDTLEDLQAIEGSPVFLYLVAPDLQIGDITKRVVNNQQVFPEKKNPKVIAKQSKTTEVNSEPSLSKAEDKTVKVMIPEVIEKEIDEEKGAIGLELMMLENCDIVSNVDNFECPICLMNYGPLDGIVLRDCLHTFCKTCLANTIKYCNDAEVKCPFRDNSYTCESTLQEREIKALVEPEIYEQHLTKSLTQAKNSAGKDAFLCKTPDCLGWCIYDDNVNHFLCPVCKKNNCLTCRAIHEGRNCWQYQQDVKISKETDQESKRTAAMLSDMLRRGEAMACPTCDVVLMKKMGCDWLRCSMCRTEICWVTKGPRWGPGGSGDVSGGCKCGQNGVKCHPLCSYCH